MTKLSATGKLSATVENLRFIEKVINLLINNDMYGEILWGRSDGQINAAVMCSDIFFWGCSDAEELTEEALPVLEQAYKDCDAIVLEVFANGNELTGETFGSLLYCARQRKLRPQGACYKAVLPEELRPLFDACGPEREIDIGNPQSQQGEYLYKREDEEE